jgi:hypothetical protein
LKRAYNLFKGFGLGGGWMVCRDRKAAFLFGGVMSLRGEIQASQRNFLDAVAEAEQARPHEMEFKLVNDVIGAVIGCVKYSPSTDSVEITVDRTDIMIPGTCLESLRNALNKLLG